MSAINPTATTTAERFAPGNFVTEGTTERVGITRAVKDRREADPLILVKWLDTLTDEWIRSHYLYRADK